VPINTRNNTNTRNTDTNTANIASNTTAAASAPADASQPNPARRVRARSRRRSREPMAVSTAVSTAVPPAVPQHPRVRARPTSATPAAPTASEADLAPSFAALGVPASLIAALADAGITAPFPIQAATIGDALAGRDILGQGRTGSGKTLAFAIPLVARLTGTASSPGAPRGLVLSPTRELATQIAGVITPLATAAGLTVATVFGGVTHARQRTALRSGVDIVVACPGRLLDLAAEQSLTLSAVEVCVIDEADMMADHGFLPAVRRILDATGTGGQRMLFSATLADGVGALADRYLHRPASHTVAADAPPDATHRLHVVTENTRVATVAELVGDGPSVVFCRTKYRAKTLARKLNSLGVAAVELHGNLSQPQRERNLAAFTSGAAVVLVATDIAARGIHVDAVATVIHADPPAEHTAYLHRSGRTARAGAAGEVVTVVTADQLGDVTKMLRRAKVSVTAERR
jgi:superfamily II DNA/RNA helicase